MADDVVLETGPLGFPWPTLDPFLFCVHHKDDYPRGNGAFGPDASLAGRNLGMDFEVRDGFRMYHGERIPGFPQHPHRGFETLTVTLNGLVDHSDSLGAKARFGDGDAQWMTAGKGIVHSEMFPLLDEEKPNPLEFFQIWINLPAADKLCEPHFAMLWAHEIPEVELDGGSTRVTVVAGSLEGARPADPPPKSWAARADSDVAVWVVHMKDGAAPQLPPAEATSLRVLYFFRGDALTVGGKRIDQHCAIVVRPDAALDLKAEGDAAFLMLQGRPIGEPAVQHGPFVMNTAEEIQQAFADYRRTQFGGWPWADNDPVHGADRARFAVHADGKAERQHEAAQQAQASPAPAE